MLTMIGLPLSLAGGYSTLYEQFKWPLLIDLLPLNAWILIITGWFALSLLAVIILLADGSHRYTKNLIIEKDNDNKQLKNQNAANQVELTRVYRELREKDDAKVVDIPNTLILITGWYTQTLKAKREGNIDPDVMAKILTGLFDVNSVTDIVKPQPMSAKVVSTISRRIKKKMGITKKHQKPDIEWARRIYTIMDENSAGLGRGSDKEYLGLEDKLKYQSASIAETKLYNIIWEYVDNAYAGFSLELFVNIADVKSAMIYFPYQARMALKQMDERLVRATGSGLAQINHILEKYRGGEQL